MKTNFDSKSRRTLSLSMLAVTLLAILFTSCTKDKVDNDLKAFVRVTNSDEASSPQNFYLDTAKVTVSAVAYGESSDYFLTKAGDRKAEFKNSGSATVNTSFTLSLDAGGYYDVFYIGNNSYTALKNDRTMPQSGKARVRFINLSSAVSSNIDVATADGDKFLSNLAFKTASNYHDIYPTAGLSLFTTGSATVLINIPQATLEANHVYTIYISGATAQTVTYHVIAEN